MEAGRLRLPARGSRAGHAIKFPRSHAIRHLHPFSSFCFFFPFPIFYFLFLRIRIEECWVSGIGTWGRATRRVAAAVSWAGRVPSSPCTPCSTLLTLLTLLTLARTTDGAG